MPAKWLGAAGKLTAFTGQNIIRSHRDLAVNRKRCQDYMVFYLTFYGLVSFHEDIVVRGLQISTLTVQPSSDFFATLLILIVSLSLSHARAGTCTFECFT